MKFNIRNVKTNTEYTNLSYQQADKMIQDFYQRQEPKETRYATVVKIEEDVIYILLTTDWGF